MFKSIINHFKEKRLLKDSAEHLNKLLEAPIKNQKAICFNTGIKNDLGREVVVSMDGVSLLTYFADNDVSCRSVFTRKNKTWEAHTVNGVNVMLFNEYYCADGSVISRCWHLPTDNIMITLGFTDGTSFTLNFPASELTK